MTYDQPKTSRRRRGSGPDIRTHKVTVRLSPAELETVAGRAEAIGASVSRFLAESALTGTTPTLAERHSLIVELFGASRLVGAIGNHLHQLAKVAHTTGQTPPELPAALRAVERALDRIQAAVDALGSS